MEDRLRSKSMGRIIACGLSLLCCFVALAQSDDKLQNTSGTEQQLMKLERDWSEAYLRHYTAMIERILADDYVGTDGRAVMTNKAQEVEDAKAPKPGDPTPDFVVLTETLTDLKGSCLWKRWHREWTLHRESQIQR
jgi:hypothetical protein